MRKIYTEIEGRLDVLMRIPARIVLTAKDGEHGFNSSRLDVEKIKELWGEVVIVKTRDRLTAKTIRKAKRRKNENTKRMA